MATTNTTTGNAAAIDGLTLGSTTITRSSRRQASNVIGLNMSNVTIGGNLESLPGQASSTAEADGTFASSASTTTGITDASGFNGASAISARSVTGILHSVIDVGGSVVQSDGNTLGDLSGTASADANSTASAVTAESAAAVVDLSSVGLQGSRVEIGGRADTLRFNGSAKGNASATGVTVGSVDATPANSNTQGQGIDGVNAILNLNARGLSPQANYFQTPTAPFFAEFGGLTEDPGPFGENLFFRDGLTAIDNSDDIIPDDRTPYTYFNENGEIIGTATAVKGQLYTTELFGVPAGINSSGSVNDFGQLLFDADGKPVTANTPGIIVGPDGRLSTDDPFFSIYTALGGDGINGALLTPGNPQFFTVAEAPIGTLSTQTGFVLFDEDGEPSTIPVAITDAAGNSVFVGENANIDATAEALGSSQAQNTTGDTNAFGSIFSTGTTLLGDITIGGSGNVDSNSRVGLTATQNAAFANTNYNLNELVDANGLIRSGTTSAIDTDSNTTTGSSAANNNMLSIGLGTSATRNGVGLQPAALGNTSTPGIDLAAPAEVNIGTDGDVNGIARNIASADSKTTSGEAVAFTGGLTTQGGNTFLFDPLQIREAGIAGVDVTTAQLLGGANNAPGPDQGNALTVGIFNLDINAGGSHAEGAGSNDVTGDGVSVFNTSSSSTTGDATAGSSAITAGIFGADLSGLPEVPLANTHLTLGRDGSVSGYADSVNTTSSATVTGESTTANASTTSAIGNVNIDLGNNANVIAEASSSDRVSSKATTGDVVGASNISTTGLLNSDVNIGNNGGVAAIASALNEVKVNTITGNATATAVANVIAIENTPIFIGGNGSISATASMTSVVG